MSRSDGFSAEAPTQLIKGAALLAAGLLVMLLPQGIVNVIAYVALVACAAWFLVDAVQALRASGWQAEALLGEGMPVRIVGSLLVVCLAVVSIVRPESLPYTSPALLGALFLAAGLYAALLSVRPGGDAISRWATVVLAALLVAVGMYVVLSTGNPHLPYAASGGAIAALWGAYLVIRSVIEGRTQTAEPRSGRRIQADSRVGERWTQNGGNSDGRVHVESGDAGQA